MSEMPSPILIFGDPYTCKNNIVAAKKKYSSLKWVTRSASDDSLNDLRMEAGLVSWDDSEKVLLIQDLPNKNHVRDFLINLASSSPLKTKIIIWDSTCQIKIDPKEKTIDKTWSDFINAIKNIKGSKVINNGGVLTEKQFDDSVGFVINCFGKYKKHIDTREAKILLGIVGYDRGMLESDIKKMSLTCPENITTQFIIDNAFPTSKEALLYKIGNVLDYGSFEDSINLIERFLASGINSNEIAVIIARKARWQMVISYLWCSGLGWESIPNQLMDMGKFPSSIWHNDQMEPSRKKQDAGSLQAPENMVKYLNVKEGLPLRYFKSVIGKKTPKGKTAMSRKNAEVIPMFFMAEQAVNFVRDRIVRPSKLQPSELKTKLLDHSIKTYLFVQNKLAEIRYGNNPEQDLQEMVKAIVSTNIDLV